MNRAKFIVVNVLIVALLYLAHRSPLFALPSVGAADLIIGAGIAAYGVFGLLNLWFGRTKTTIHISNTLPIIGLWGTELGLVMVVKVLTGNDPSMLLDAVRATFLAVIPTLVGVSGMWWLREVIFWSAGEST